MLRIKTFIIFACEKPPVLPISDGSLWGGEAGLALRFNP